MIQIDLSGLSTVLTHSGMYESRTCKNLLGLCFGAKMLHVKVYLHIDYIPILNGPAKKNNLWTEERIAMLFGLERESDNRAEIVLDQYQFFRLHSIAVYPPEWTRNRPEIIKWPEPEQIEQQFLTSACVATLLFLMKSKWNFGPSDDAVSRPIGDVSILQIRTA